MIQQTNLSFLKCFLSFPSLATIMRKGRERKNGEGGAERETKPGEGGHEAERLNPYALAIAFPCGSEKTSGTHDLVAGSEWSRKTNY